MPGSDTSDSELDTKGVKALAKPKKVLNEKQRAGLNKGIEILKERRTRLAEEKVAREEAKAKGEPVPPAPEPKKRRKPARKPIVVVPDTAPPPEPRKLRKDAGIKRGPLKPPLITRNELESIHKQILDALPKEKIVEKIVEKPVEKVVEKVVERRIAGSELLNKIFHL